MDLDGLWIPPLKDDPAEEYGHAHFQHPERVKSRYWGRRMDGFSALVVEVSVLALAIEPDLWDRYNDGGNNLILLSEDFADHDRPIWADLEALDDPVLAVQLPKLKAACLAPCDELVGPLEMLDHAKSDPKLLPVPGWLQAELQPAEVIDVAPSSGFSSTVVGLVAAAMVIVIIVIAVWVV